MPRQQIAGRGLRFTANLTDPATVRLLHRSPVEGDRVTTRGELTPSGHALTVELEYREGAYRVARVTVDAAEGAEVTSADLGIPVKEAAEKVLAGVWATFGETADYLARRADFQQGQRRRWMTEEHLQGVAATYEAAEAAGAQSIIGAVADHYSAGYSTAQRWVREARKRELLAPAPPRRKRGER